MANPWDSDPEVSSQIPTQNPWDKDPEVTAAPVISPPVGSRLTALLQGFGQGATLGILPYMQAGASYALQGLTPSASSPNWSNTLADVKAQQAQIAQQQPGAYMSGNLVGTALPAVLTGGESLLGRGALGTVEGLGTRAATSTIGRNVAAGTVQGAAGAETPSDIIPEALKGGAISGTTTGVLGGAGQVASYFKNYQGRQILANTLEQASNNPQIQNAVTRSAQAAGNFSSTEAAAIQTQNWFGKAIPAQPIDLGKGQQINPGDPLYTAVAQQYPGIVGKPEGYVYDLIKDLRDPTVTTSELATKTKDETTSPYGLLNRTITATSATQPGFVKGAISGGQQTLAKLPWEVGMGALGYTAGGIPGAIMGAAAPIAGMAMRTGVGKAASQGAARSYANILSSNRSGPVAGQVLGQIGGGIGRVGNQNFTDIILNSPFNQSLGTQTNQ